MSLVGLLVTELLLSSSISMTSNLFLFSPLNLHLSPLTSHLSPTTPILFQALVHIVASSQAIYHTLH